MITAVLAYIDFFASSIQVLTIAKVPSFCAENLLHLLIRRVLGRFRGLLSQLLQMSARRSPQSAPSS
jgi:hypothetical protein